MLVSTRIINGSGIDAVAGIVHRDGCCWTCVSVHLGEKLFKIRYRRPAARPSVPLPHAPSMATDRKIGGFVGNNALAVEMGS